MRAHAVSAQSACEPRDGSIAWSAPFRRGSRPKQRAVVARSKERPRSRPQHGRLPGKLSSWPQTPLLASIAGVHDAVRVDHFRIRVECATRLAASAMVSWPSAQSCEGERVRRHRGTQSVADFEPLLLHGARPTREPPGACFKATPTPSCGPGSLLTTLNHFVPPTLTLESLFVNTIQILYLPRVGDA